MLFTPYEVELLRGVIQMFDRCPEPFDDSNETHLTLSRSCNYKLAHLNNLTCFTEDELAFLTGAVHYSISSRSVIVDKRVRDDLTDLIWKISAL